MLPPFAYRCSLSRGYAGSRATEHMGGRPCRNTGSWGCNIVGSLLRCLDATHVVLSGRRAAYGNVCSAHAYNGTQLFLQLQGQEGHPKRKHTMVHNSLQPGVVIMRCNCDVYRQMCETRPDDASVHHHLCSHMHCTLLQLGTPNVYTQSTVTTGQRSLFTERVHTTTCCPQEETSMPRIQAPAEYKL